MLNRSVSSLERCAASSDVDLNERGHSRGGLCVRAELNLARRPQNDRMNQESLSALKARVQQELDQKTKPAGALPTIDALAMSMALAQESDTPSAHPATALVFAADHGISRDGVSAYPREVTAQMVLNFAGGGAAVCTFARAAGASVKVFDVGVDCDDFAVEGIYGVKVARGTGNIRVEPAMTRDLCDAALKVGKDALALAVSEGARVVTIGEMGIGNTSSASALTAALLKMPAAELVGPGTGVSGDALSAKARAVEEAVQRVGDESDPFALLAELGGLEIAAMVGVCLHARSHRCVVVVDGFIASVAALYAMRIDERVRKQLVWGHRSSEPGHDIVLDAAGGTPLLDLKLRLGEGSGAMLALPLLHAACTMLNEMATFGSAGVSDKDSEA